MVPYYLVWLLKVLLGLTLSRFNFFGSVWSCMVQLSSWFRSQLILMVPIGPDEYGKPGKFKVYQFPIISQCSCKNLSLSLNCASIQRCAFLFFIKKKMIRQNYEAENCYIFVKYYLLTIIC